MDLQEVVEKLGKIDSYEFASYLLAYINHYKDFLDEITVDSITKRRYYTHRRLRSAVKSLQTNLPYLFTYEDYKELKIPTTSNTLESHFSHIKDIVRIHRGLKRSLKEKLIETILLNSSIVKN